ncbi:2-oxoisovalerate dehydrogenase subunit alpha mitochondrial-like-like, partial [Trifolium medium]|nr:2-oxoisovalerate dehydrogenase subunit alpha mitochondrial-like-like [Trifolium medium]
YREPGVLLWRGFTLQQIAHQCFGNTNDLGKGRQMPIHYGSNKHNYFTVSSPIATQLPQAVGAAYSLKMDGKNACAVTFCGDGATSEVCDDEYEPTISLKKVIIEEHITMVIADI